MEVAPHISMGGQHINNKSRPISQRWPYRVPLQYGYLAHPKKDPYLPDLRTIFEPHLGQFEPVDEPLVERLELVDPLAVLQCLQILPTPRESDASLKSSTSLSSLHLGHSFKSPLCMSSIVV